MCHSFAGSRMVPPHHRLSDTGPIPRRHAARQPPLPHGPRASRAALTAGRGGAPGGGKLQVRCVCRNRTGSVEALCTPAAYRRHACDHQTACVDVSHVSHASHVLRVAAHPWCSGRWKRRSSQPTSPSPPSCAASSPSTRHSVCLRQRLAPSQPTQGDSTSHRILTLGPSARISHLLILDGQTIIHFIISALDF